LFLGNLDAQRDWGHAKDYVKAMYLILQQDQPSDYVIATGITTSVRTFVKKAFEEAGVQIRSEGSGVEEKIWIDSINEARFVDRVGPEYLEKFRQRINTIAVEVDPAYFRPTEVDLLIGDPTKSKEQLGWEPE